MGMTEKNKGKSTPLIQSLDRGLILIDVVAKSPQPVSLNQLTEVLNIDRSSVFRLANTLKRRGFLMHANGSRDYILGPSLWRYGRIYNWGNMLVRIAHTYLQSLTAETGETSHLAILEGDRALFVDHVTTNHMIVVSGQTGETVPLYCTAHGKALLIDMDQQDLDSLLGPSPWEARTANTITDSHELAQICKKTRQQGFVTDDEELLEGIRCVAAPIRDKDGSVMASIGISTPIDRFPKSRYKVCGAQVLAIAQQISQRVAQQEQGD